ncbi:uncharacterized protein LOC122347367 [Puntigrus tetrazona]|uniref:uncharacterized protein LOC122347367 n=1 Tax=Puntigrus tetrazona TaxID=1606681 RepID=UPI001C8AB06B|nr:uncharacterized protein LOC122347367 [Puntigrus tetrazona]
MPCVVRYSSLLISICLKNILCAEQNLPAESMTVAVGNEVIIQCATDKTPLDGVYMYKKGSNENKHLVFYYYKDGTFNIKEAKYKDRFRVIGIFPKLLAYFSNVTTSDIGVYWCEFNFDENITLGKVTGLFIKIMDSRDNKLQTNMNDTKAVNITESQNNCTENIHVKIVLAVCAVLSLLCVIGFIFVIVKVKGRWGNKKNRPSNEPPDSVYEEMKRSNFDIQPSVRMLINHGYQTTKLFC